MKHGRLVDCRNITPQLYLSWDCVPQVIYKYLQFDISVINFSAMLFILREVTFYRARAAVHTVYVHRELMICTVCTVQQTQAHFLTFGKCQPTLLSTLHLIWQYSCQAQALCGYRPELNQMMRCKPVHQHPL